MNKIFGMLLLSMVTLTACTNESGDNDSNPQATNVVKKKNSNGSSSYRKLPKCGEGQHAVLSYEFENFNFHRPSKNCESGFSVCIQGGHWEVECHDMNHNVVSVIRDKKAYVWAQLSEDETKAELHFPIELKNTQGYLNEDFSTFYLEREYVIYEDVTLRPGTYNVKETETELVVVVDLI